MWGGIHRYEMIAVLSLILAGIGLRFYKVGSIPGGVLDDEAAVINYTERSFSEKKWTPYWQNQATAETLHGVLQSFLPCFTEPFFDSYKYWASFFNIILLALFGFGIYYFHSLRLALWSVAFLSLNYWHIFYSRISGTTTGVVFLVLLSSLLFIFILRKPSRLTLAKWGLVALFMVNLVGFFYYTSFRVVILAQFLVLILWYRRLEFSWPIILTTLITGLGTILLIYYYTETPINYLWGRGTFNVTNLNEPNPLLNIWYSLILPFWKPPVVFSYPSSHFMGDPISYAFYYGSSFFILGSTFTYFLFIGVLRFIKKTQFSELSINLKYLLLLFVLFILIIGYAGPSFSRLLPLVLIFSILGGMGAIFIYDLLKIKGSKFSKVLRVSMTLLLFATLPLLSAFRLAVMPNEQVVHFWFNNKSVQSLDIIAANSHYHLLKKYIVCPTNMELCRFYAKRIPNLKPLSYYGQIKQILTEKRVSDRSVYLIWIDPPKIAPIHYQEMVSFSLDYNFTKLQRELPIRGIDRVTRDGELLFSFIEVAVP